MISLDDIRAAQARLDGVAVKTSLVPWADAPASERWFFKPEGLQPIGAFKLRGGYNKIASLTPEERERGVIAFSSGNHAQGVAYAARTEAMGAEVVLLHEGGEEEWRAHAEALAQEQGLTMVPPFNDETVIAGNGTCGLEILAEAADVDLVLVPIGGGGLISGIGAALKMCKPDVKIIGVEPELANDAQLSLRRGGIVALPIEQTKETLADGMRATQVGDITFRYIREYVDDIITVSEDEIRAAVRELALGSRLVVEPSGAVTAAALFNRRGELPAAKTVVAVLSGGNIEPGLLADILV